MKRMTLLLLPLVAMAVGEPESTTRKIREETLGQLWQESATAETNGDSAAAIEKLNAFAKSGGDPFLVSLRSGWLNYSAKNYDESATHYIAAMKLRPTALSPRVGLLKVAQGKAESALILRAADGVLKVDPNNYSALMAMAWEIYQKKDYRRAKAIYQHALDLYPEDQDALSGVAWCYFYTGMKRDARDGFLKLMSLNPDYPHVREGLSLVGK